MLAEVAFKLEPAGSRWNYQLIIWFKPWFESEPYLRQHCTPPRVIYLYGGGRICWGRNSNISVFLFGGSYSNIVFIPAPSPPAPPGILDATWIQPKVFVTWNHHQ